MNTPIQALNTFSHKEVTLADINAEMPRLDKVATWAGTLTTLSSSFEREAERNNKAVRDGFEDVLFGADK